MSKSQEWKDKRDHCINGRMDYAKRKLAEHGFNRIKEEGYALIISFQGKDYRYFPFTGGVVGPSIHTRGLSNLIAILQAKRI